MAKQVKGVIGLQCKDGMQVSALMAAIYLIEEFEFEVDSVVGYMRMVRPGCLHSLQHEYMRRRYRDTHYFPFGKLEDLPKEMSPARSRKKK